MSGYQNRGRVEGFRRGTATTKGGWIGVRGPDGDEGAGAEAAEGGDVRALGIRQLVQHLWRDTTRRARPPPGMSLTHGPGSAGPGPISRGGAKTRQTAGGGKVAPTATECQVKLNRLGPFQDGASFHQQAGTNSLERGQRHGWGGYLDMERTLASNCFRQG